MGIIDDNKTILLDTNCFIYYFEDNINYSNKLERVFNNIQDGKNIAFMSVISYIEILVKPKKENNVFIENRYKLVLTNYPNLSIVNVDHVIANIAAKLRASYSIKTPDAIIIATALYMNADAIITNDIRLKDICNKEGLEIIIIDKIEE